MPALTVTPASEATVSTCPGSPRAIMPGTDARSPCSTP